jgi:uncharacterized protein (DUF736 family)
MLEPEPGTSVDIVGHKHHRAKAARRVRVLRRTEGWDIEVGIGWDGVATNDATAVFKRLADAEALHRELGRAIEAARREQNRRRWVRPEDRVSTPLLNDDRTGDLQGSVAASVPTASPTPKKRGSRKDADLALTGGAFYIPGARP